MKRRRGDSQGQNTVNNAESNDVIIIIEPDNERRRERENPQAGDNRAETNVDKPENGTREAGSGMRPNIKKHGTQDDGSK